MSYNGWSNRETWLVNVWYNPESLEMLDHIRSVIEEQYDEMPDGPLKDMIDLNAIDWDELKSSLDDVRSFLNVVEDIRIERKIRMEYPGIKSI